jgi:hypothetical protein
MYETIGWRPYVQSWLYGKYGPKIDSNGVVEVEEYLTE